MKSTKDILTRLPFTAEHDEDKIDFLVRMGQEVKRDRGYVLTKQYERSHSFFFLVSGLVDFSISVEEGEDEFSVGKSSEPLTPVGWSGFRSPFRYATTVTCDQDSRFIQWSHAHLEKFFEQEPELGRDFILFVLERSMGLLRQVREQLSSFGYAGLDMDAGQKAEFNEDEDLIVPDALTIIKQSPFFEIFPEHILAKLASAAGKRTFMSGERLFAQGEKAEGIELLAVGKIVLGFNPGTENEQSGSVTDDSVAVRHIHHPGYIVGLAGADPNIVNGVTAVATRNSVIYHIRREDIGSILNVNPDISLAFSKRLLWLIGNLLSDSRARLISLHYEQEILAVSNLIEQNSTQLSVRSSLHKVPSLLENVLTLEDAFRILFELESGGSTLEKGIARSSLDILGRVYKEFMFFDGLKTVYESVSDADESSTPAELRILSSSKFTEVFENVPYVVEGWENLPENTGNIFIFNHLLNHPYNTLPNNFQLTLDSHFVSSMILYRRYGDPGIRVVRVPRADEYGHQGYYERLGHINVYTKESVAGKETKARSKARRERFYTTASEYLKNGINLVLNPEGTSLETEDSPGPFRPGAFMLAASVNPEPLIVPMAVANFDKRVNRNVFSMVIKKPFRITEYVEEPANNREKLYRFLEEYRNEFRSYVEEAVELAEKEASRKINIGSFESVTK